jgi:hypothetical protein
MARDVVHWRDGFQDVCPVDPWAGKLLYCLVMIRDDRPLRFVAPADRRDTHDIVLEDFLSSQADGVSEEEQERRCHEAVDRGLVQLRTDNAWMLEIEAALTSLK